MNSVASNELTHFHRYIRAFYLTITWLSSIGNNIDPITKSEIGLSILFSMLSLIYISYIFFEI